MAPVTASVKNRATIALTKMDKIRNERIRGTTKVGKISKENTGKKV